MRGARRVPLFFLAYKSLRKKIVAAFYVLPIREGLKKPRVRIGGELLVKFMPLANNHIVDLSEAEGAEAVKMIRDSAVAALRAVSS